MRRRHQPRPDTAAALARADAERAAGRLLEAVALYRGVLRLAPEHPAALHRLGVMARGGGYREAALGPFDRALAARPDLPVGGRHSIAPSCLRRLDAAIEGLRAAAAARATETRRISVSTMRYRKRGASRRRGRASEVPAPGRSRRRGC